MRERLAKSLNFIFSIVLFGTLLFSVPAQEHPLCTDPSDFCINAKGAEGDRQFCKCKKDTKSGCTEDRSCSHYCRKDSKGFLCCRCFHPGCDS
jgi:hypothetical protein